MMGISLLNIVIFLFQVNILIGDPIVELPNGQILGRQAITIENHTFFAFEGIPYAAPPIGPLRFKAPQLPEKWNGILNTTYFEVTCFQTSNNADNESEDCLYINVFTPELPDANKNISLPVMFFIYGGGFVDGFPQPHPPDLFINNDVILVTFSYRVGPFGFLSTQDEVIPGNNGLKDQQLALQWTFNNIHLFGGNQNQITIFGQSAGSASCTYQLLNQNNEGLFQSAILESGTFLSPWAFQRNARKIAFATAAIINSTFEHSNNAERLLEFLLSVSARDLDSAAEEYYNNEFGPEDIEMLQGYFWAPVIEVKNPDAFLTKKMFGLLEAGNIIKVPVMIGINSEESLNGFEDPEVLKSWMRTFDNRLDLLVPGDMQIGDKTNRTEMGRLMREIYTSGENLEEHLGDGVRLCSDNFLTRSVIKYAELYSKVSKLYFYVFSYDGEMGQFDVLYDGAEKVCHGEELKYLFCSGSECDSSSYPESDTITRKRLIKLWTDFAKYQNPTPEKSLLLENIIWPEVAIDDDNFFYLDIFENLEIKNHPKAKAYKRWVQLYDSLGYTDFDTY